MYNFYVELIANLQACRGYGYEHWSFFCVEKSFWAGGLAPHRGHGYALEEYAIRRRRWQQQVLIYDALIGLLLFGQQTV